jgi:Protein of unknown function (DUF2541)
MMASKLSRIGLTLLSALTLAMAIAPATFAQRTQFLGQTRLSVKENDLDVLKLPRCQLPPVRDIRLKALRGSAEILLLVVQYGNNQLDRLPVRSKIRQGSETNWIALKGNLRCIKGIAIVGNTINSRDRAIIQFYAR